MSVQEPIPELYDADDIRREAQELERMARLRASAKKLRKLNVLPFVLALPLSVLLIGILSAALSQDPTFSVQLVLNWAIFPLAFAYSACVIALQRFYCEARYNEEVERLRRLFLNDHRYQDALKRLDRKDPGAAKRIRRMKYVIGEPAN